MPEQESLSSRDLKPISPQQAEELRRRVLELAAPADQALSDNLKTHVSHIDEVSRYIIFSGGKRLRPALFLLANRALAGTAEAKYASIFEYLHAATLLHDDVVDEAGLRRGRPAARVRYGNDSVILVGDFLFSKSYSLAVELGDIRFMQALTDCTTYMAEGQVLELIHTDDLDLSPAGYLEVIRAKTAVLIAAACQMGAIAAQASADQVKALYDYGMALGIAFQMVDDALDYVGTQHEFGKPVGHDLAEGKITLPFIHARDQEAVPDGSRLRELARQSRTRPEALQEAKELVRASGGVEFTMEQARAYAARAQAALAPLNPGSSKGDDLNLLHDLAAYVVTRRS